MRAKEEGGMEEGGRGVRRDHQGRFRSHNSASPFASGEEGKTARHRAPKYQLKKEARVQSTRKKTFSLLPCLPPKTRSESTE